MKYYLKRRALAIYAVLIIVIASCGDDNTETARVQVALVDAPAAYDQVLVSVEDVQINVSSDGNDENGWQSLDEVEAKTYDLLTLTNGEEAFLGEIELGEGQLGQIRLILGDVNQLVMEGNTVDLTVPSGSETGLKLNVNAEILAGVTYKLVLDFDAAKSVVKAGNSGMYNLKPVIRAQMEALTGAIEGVVSPIDTDAVVYAIQGSDSVSTYPDENGEYLIRALLEGTYDVVAVPENENLTKATIEDVSVTIGEVNQIDTLEMSN